MGELDKTRNLEQIIADKIKTAFVELVPEERWSRMVQQTVETFERDELPKLVNEELRKLFLTALSEWLEAEGRSQWDENLSTHIPGKAVKKIIAECGPQILVSFFNQIVGQEMDKLRCDISQRLNVSMY